MAPPEQSRFFIIIIIFLAILSILFSLAKGSTSISLEQLFFVKNSVILQLRLERTLAAFISGALLALAGLLMQLLLQNPLADPYVLGTSSGAALGILLLMLLGVPPHWLIAGAWAGSLQAIAVISLLARNHQWQTHRLLLIGLSLAAGFSALISCILLLSPTTQLQSMLYWLSGDLNNASLPWFGIIVLSMGCCICLALAPGLNILARGELEAATLGLATKRHQQLLYLLSSLFTATAVTIGGSIGFIGLIIPHLTRRLVGYNHLITIPSAILLGGSLLTVADTLARHLFAPTQVPVGILIALIGVPVFIGLLQ